MPSSRLIVRGTLAVLALVVGAWTPRVSAQARLNLFPGTQPVKAVGGPDVAWDGSQWRVPPGGVIDWTVTVVHDDPALTDVTTDVSDDIPDAADGLPMGPFNPATDVLARPADGTPSYNGDSLALDAPFVTLGGSYTFTFRSRVLASAPVGTVLCNRAFVSYTGPEDGMQVPERYLSRTFTPDGVDQPTCVTVGTGPNLATSTKTAADADGDGLVEPGEDVTWTITLRNSGTADATSLVVNDDVGGAMTPSSAGQGGRVAATSVIWDSTGTPALARLRPGTSMVLTLVTRAGCAPDASMACNQAQVSFAGAAAPVPTDDPATSALSDATCLRTARAVLAGSPMRVSDASGDGLFEPGEGVTFTLVATNAGSGAGTGVSASVAIPAGLVGVVPRNGGTLAGGTVTWTPAGEPALARLAPGSSVTLAFDASIDPAAADGATACAQADLASTGCPPELSDDASLPGASDATCLRVSAAPRLALDLSEADASGDGLLEGDELLTLTLVARWVGGASARDVTVTLDADALSLAGLVADAGGTVAGATATWTSTSTPALATLGPGDRVVLHATAHASCTARDGVAACSVGALVAANLGTSVISDDPSLPGASDPTCVVLALPELRATLLATDGGGDGVFDAGEAATLTLRLTDAGSAPARDVGVRLPIPASDLAAVATAGGTIAGGVATWSPSTTPALSRIDPGASVDLGVTLRIDPAAAGQRTCHQAEVRWSALASCGPLLSNDPAAAPPPAPTCWLVAGNGLPPGEVQNGDPLGAGAIPVRLSCSGSDLRLTWGAAPRALTHLVYRGPIASFALSPWTNPSAAITDPENAIPSCDLDTLAYVDARECAPGGTSDYFLVAGRNLAGDGPLGPTVSSAGSSERPPPALPCP